MFNCVLICTKRISGSKCSCSDPFCPRWSCTRKTAPVKSIQMPLGSTGSGSWSFVNTLKLALCLMPTSSVDPNSCISRWARLNNGYAGLGEPLQQSAANTPFKRRLRVFTAPFCSLHLLYESLNLSSCSGVISLGDLDRSRLERSPIHYRDSKE